MSSQSIHWDICIWSRSPFGRWRQSVFFCNLLSLLKVPRTPERSVEVEEAMLSAKRMKDSQPNRFYICHKRICHWVISVTSPVSCKHLNILRVKNTQCCRTPESSLRGPKIIPRRIRAGLFTKSNLNFVWTHCSPLDSSYSSAPFFLGLYSVLWFWPCMIS